MLVDLSTPEFRADPYPIYAQLRHSNPIVQMKSRRANSWIVTRYDDVMAILKDPRFCNDSRKLNPEAEKRANAWWQPRLLSGFRSTMLSLDDPDHRRVRDLVHRAFTPRMIEQLRGQVDQVSLELLAQIGRQERLDLIAGYALPIPLTVISNMLGVPEQDRVRFSKWSSAFLETISGDLSGAVFRLPLLYQMVRFFRRLIALRQHTPGDDLLSALIQVENLNERLSDEELIALIFLLLLAGHETTVNLIGSGMLALMENPDQLQLLREKPELIDSAIEELLRYANPIDRSAPRFAREDVEMGGVVIPKGSMVWLALSSANRDESAFPNADRLDITRQPNKHIAFGNGVHYCLGAPLARLEGKIALQGLIERFPNMHLAVPRDALEWRNAINVRGLKALPVFPR
jgi:cytochrome P450